MSVEGSPRPLKRDHDSFEELADLEQPFSVPADFLERLKEQEHNDGDTDSLPTPPISVDNKRDQSPARSSTGSLSDAASHTPSLSIRGNSPGIEAAPIPMPSAFAALNGAAPPPPKKVKLSFAEKELERINKEIRDKEKAEDKARKEAERQAKAAEKAKKDAEKAEDKARKDAEKEADRKKKEAEKEEKRAAIEADKAAKEEKRRKKEEEKQKAEDEKRKKEKGQMKLGNFFNIPTPTKVRASSADSRGRNSMSPAPAIFAFTSPAVSTPSKPQQSYYDKLFPAFFIQNGVTLAPMNRFERDEEASLVIQNTIDQYLTPETSNRPYAVSFDAQSLFHLHNPYTRGKETLSVREIMADFFSGNASKPIDLTTDSQNSQIKRTRGSLEKVPMKFLKFQEDVRPPYWGTYTSRPVTSMAKLARNPLRRDLPDTNYDYDSEAEWIEDEDAEDLKSEGDEEEEIDDDEDMDEFLDDENDETANSRRLVIQGDLEPVSTGLCWEDRKKRNSNVKMIAYRMEVILAPEIKSIDPFSTAYWESVPSNAMDPPRIPLHAMKTTSVNVNGNTKLMKPFFVNGPESSKPAPQVPTKDTKGKKMISESDMEAFKQAIQGSNLTKVGLIEVLKKQFPGRPAAAIKGTLETIARRVGTKEVDKRWVVIDPSVS